MKPIQTMLKALKDKKRLLDKQAENAHDNSAEKHNLSGQASGIQLAVDMIEYAIKNG